jgi:hypothetical protein
MIWLWLAIAFAAGILCVPLISIAMVALVDHVVPTDGID